MGKIMDSISKTFPFPYTQLSWVLELLAFPEKIWIDISRFFLQQATCFRGETVTWYLKTERVSWILFSHFVRIIILTEFRAAFKDSPSCFLTCHLQIEPQHFRIVYHDTRKNRSLNLELRKRFAMINLGWTKQSFNYRYVKSYLRDLLRDLIEASLNKLRKLI